MTKAEESMKVFKPDTVEESDCMHELSDLEELVDRAEQLYKQGATVYYLKAIKKELRDDGPRSSRLPGLMINIAGILEEQKLFKEALDWLDRAVRTDTRLYGPKHLEVAIDLGHRAATHKARARCELELAEDDLEQAIKITEEVLGKEHLELATHLYDLGLLYMLQGKDAVPYFKRALGIMIKYFSSDSQRVALYLKMVAAQYTKEGKYEQALLICKEAEKMLGEEHPLLSTVRKNKEEIWREMYVTKKSDDVNAHTARTLPPDECSILPVSPYPDDDIREVYTLVLTGTHENDFKCLERLLQKNKGRSTDMPSTLFVLGRNVYIASPLFITCALGKQEMTEILLLAGFSLARADPNGNTSFQYAAAYGHLGLLSFLWRNFRDTYESIFRAHDKYDRDAYTLRECVLSTNDAMLISSDIIAKYSIPIDFKVIVDQDEIMHEKDVSSVHQVSVDDVLSFLRAECKFRALEPECTSKDAGEQDTPSTELPCFTMDTDSGYEFV